MPRFTETMRTRIQTAEALYQKGRAGQAKDELEIIQAMTLVYIAEQLVRMTRAAARGERPLHKTLPIGSSRSPK